MKYLTVFWYGAARQICSEHRTFYGAERAALKCERGGGARHFIWEVREYQIVRQEKKRG